MMKSYFVKYWFKIALPFFLVGISLSDTAAQLVINEVSSKNGDVLFDADGDSPDWIEIYNTGTNTVDLTGYYLSDDDENPEQWAFPSGQIAPGGFLVVFASEKENIQGELHANFKLKSSGEELLFSDPNGNLLDRWEVIGMQQNHSYGRQTDGTDNWFVFVDPTPGTSNTTTPSPGYAPDALVDENQAFFIAPIEVNVSNTMPTATMYYTLDGSLPTTSSPIVSGPFYFDQTSVLRILTLAPGRLPSNVVTRTFFINDAHKLPVLSMSTDASNLFDPDTGIYVPGPNADSTFPYWGANFWEKWERPIHLEMYLPNRRLAFSEDLGVRMHGGIQSRLAPARAFRILAKQEFGTSKINFPVFPDKPVEEFDRIILRNSGIDFNRAHFRDGYLHQLMIEEGIKCDFMAYRPAVLYLNGEYWGIYNMRERVDLDYLRSNHPEIGKVGIDLLEETFLVIDGDSVPMRQLWEFMIANDLSDPANYQTVSDQMDIENVADYFIAETYWNNADWPNNNVKFWRPQTDSGKWQYILIDLDVSLNSVGWIPPEFNNLQNVLNFAEIGSTHAQVLKNLLDNEGFRHYFINRYADLMNTSFLPERMEQELDEVVDNLDDEIPRHVDRWATRPNPVDFWYSEIDKVSDFVNKRHPIARNYVQEVFELDGQVELQLNVYPPEAGKILINTITPESLPWDGVYFNGVPVTLTIQPNPGYNFKHWESLHTVTSPDPQASITYNFEQDDRITAYFEESIDDLEVTVFPNPSSDQQTVRFVLDQIDEVEITINDLYGRLVGAPLKLQLNGGLQSVNLNRYFRLDELQGVYWVNVTSTNKQGAAKFVRIVAD